MMHVFLPPGAVLFEEDDPADSMFVILTGRLDVRSHPLVEPPKEEEICKRMANVAMKSGSMKSRNENIENGEMRGTPSPDQSPPSVPDTGSHEEEKPISDGEGHSQKANNSQYWINQYFQQARTTIQAQDPSSGCGNSVSPLASIYAAKWRQTILDRKTQEEEEQKPEALTGTH